MGKYKAEIQSYGKSIQERRCGVMARYIDADELFEEIKSLSVFLGGDSVFNKTAKESVLDIIDKQPTADVAEVVRCKDCVKRGTFDCVKSKRDHPTTTKNEEFCCWGERRKV